MSSDNKVVYLDTAKPTPSSLELIDSLRQLSVKRLAALLRHMLDNVDDALFTRAERAESDATQELYFVAMRQMRLRRREIEEAFQRELLADFRTLTASAATPQSGDVGAGDAPELGLVDEEALERSVAVDAMVSRAVTRVSLPLEQLRTRLDYLLSDRRVDETRNPLHPRRVCEAFQRAAEPAEVPLEPQLIVFKLFEKYVLGQLPGLCDEANRLFIEAGVLPKLTAGAQQSHGGAKRRPSRSSQPPPEPASDEQDAEARKTFELIHGLLSETKYGAGDPQWTGAGYVSGPTATVEDVVAALSRLQNDQSAMQRSTVPGEADIKALLTRALAGEGAEQRSLGRTEDDTIDIVSMLFDVILDDPNLPDSIKALVARLQIPVLKVALADKSFFSRKNHPARALINELARSAVGWNEPQDVSQDPFYRQVESVVNRVLVGFQQDVSLFQNLLDEFRGFLEQERERARQVEERTRQAAEGKAKVEYAKAQVEREIAERLAGRQPPAVVEQLLQGPWSKVLFISYLKEGDEGETFYRQLEVVDRLLASVERPEDGEQRRQMLKEIPALLADLREGLNAILFNPFEMTKLFKELEAVHVRLLTRPAGEDEAPSREQTGNAGDELLIESVTEQRGETAEHTTSEAGAEREAYMEELAELPIGTWFEFGDAGGNCVRAKLSARLNGGRRLIFVNRAGFKLADKILEDMADDLVAGRAVMLDDNMLFDRALESVIVNLRKARAGHG